MQSIEYGLSLEVQEEYALDNSIIDTIAIWLLVDQLYLTHNHRSRLLLDLFERKGGEGAFT